MDFSGGASGKRLAANAGDTRDLGLIPGLGRSPVGGNGDLLISRVTIGVKPKSKRS